jgi:type IV pilus assembly protein PilC
VADYLCKVADASGRVFSEVEAAQSIDEARQKLSDRGLYVYSVRAQQGFLTGLLSRQRKRAVHGEDFLVFNQQFNTMIKAGLPILKALDLLSERAASPKLRPLLMEVRQRVRDGELLSEALDQQGSFPKVYTTTVLAGEKSGDLPGVLEHYIAYQRVSTGLKKKLVGAIIYPIFLIVTAILIVSYIVTYVIPQFAKLYQDMQVELPLPTRIMVAIAVEFRPYVIGGVVALALFVIGIFLWSRTEVGSLAVDRARLRLPYIGETWVKFQVAQVMRTLSTLITGGTPLVQALNTTADAATSRLISDAIRQSAQSVREGQSLRHGLEGTRVFPELALEMVEVGEASGALPAMLVSVADFYEDDVNTRVSRAISFVEPAILVFMAVIVLFILISLYLPIFSFGMNSKPGG